MKLRKFAVCALLGSSLIFTGCSSLLGGKKNKQADLSGYIDGFLEEFFKPLDEESTTLTVAVESE